MQCWFWNRPRSGRRACDWTGGQTPGMTAAMRYRLGISEEALEQLRALPKETGRRLGQKLDSLQTDLQGDVRKLGG